MRKRFMLIVLAVLALTVAFAVPVGAKEFGTIISFTNFEQGGVAQFAPGEGSHGGRWAVTMATWVDAADARLVTDYDEILALADAGEITLVRAPDADFRCPILPNS